MYNPKWKVKYIYVNNQEEINKLVEKITKYNNTRSYPGDPNGPPPRDCYLEQLESSLRAERSKSIYTYYAPGGKIITREEFYN